VGVVPATVLLTRHVRGPRWIPAGRVARAGALVVLVLGSVATFHHAAILDRVLGVVSLLLAASLVSLVAASERRRQSATRTD
jgi:4-hydroxybenzoate polyprenyltransferase